MIEPTEVYAWVGADELGTGEVGIKQYVGDRVPLVSVSRDKLSLPRFIRPLQAQANTFGKPIRLVRYVAVEVVQTLTPVSREN